jgi:hypothetical protein
MAPAHGDRIHPARLQQGRHHELRLDLDTVIDRRDYRMGGRLDDLSAGEAREAGVIEKLDQTIVDGTILGGHTGFV